MADPMRIGRKYFVIYKMDGIHRVPRCMIAQFLGDVGNGILSFSGRPEFGTTEIDEKYVIEVIPVDSKMKCYADRKYRQ